MQHFYALRGISSLTTIHSIFLPEIDHARRTVKSFAWSINFTSLSYIVCHSETAITAKIDL